MSLEAYRSASVRSENPRDLEYRLFGEVTRALMAAEKTPADDYQTRADALDWNRRMWTALASDCSSENNGLPDSLRAQLISISLWVGRHTSAAIRNQEEIGPLIDINRIIMQGLAPQPRQNAA